MSTAPTGAPSDLRHVATEDARQDHINGPIAGALMAEADELLAAPPDILPADVLASKWREQRRFNACQLSRCPGATAGQRAARHRNGR